MLARACFALQAYQERLELRREKGPARPLLGKALRRNMTLARFTGNIATTTAGETVVHAARTMRDRRVGCLIAVESGHPIGIVTDRDLVVRALAGGADPANALVGDFVTYSPITVSVHDGVETAAERMRAHGIRRLPIVNDAGEAIGIVTADDLLALLGSEIGAVCEGIQTASDSTDSR